MPSTSYELLFLARYLLSLMLISLFFGLCLVLVAFADLLEMVALLFWAAITRLYPALQMGYLN